MLDDKVLRRLQLTQVEMLKVVDKVCKDHHIEYSLYAGTLLGAIRHKGFIPWDDDLDICMSRENYNKFLNVWQELDMRGYFLQNIDTDENFTQTFTKIRKNNTAFVQKGEDNIKLNTGIFIDIFPIDKIPRGTIKRNIQLLYASLYLVFSRRFVNSKDGLVLRILERILLSTIPKSKQAIIRDLCVKKLSRFNKRLNLQSADYSTFSSAKIYFPRYLMDDLIEVEFEGYKYPAYKHWDEWLRLMYGDYMKLPPKEERVCPHTAIYISFDSNNNERKKYS